MREYVADIQRTWEEFDVTVAEIRAAPPLMLVFGRVYARAGGFVADNPLAFVWEVGDDGLVRWGKAFTDRSAAEAFALECARCEPPS
jgi:hypothetical protein